MGKGESIEIWPLRRPMKREDFLKEKEVPKEKVGGIPETVWVEVGPVLSNHDQLKRIWEIFKAFEECRREEGLVLLARKSNKSWLGEKEEVEFFVARPETGISNDFLKRKKLFLIPDEKTLKNL